MVVSPIIVGTKKVIISYKLIDQLMARLIICSICNETIEERQRAIIYDSNYIHSHCRGRAILDFRLRFPYFMVSEVAEIFGISASRVQHFSPRSKYNGFKII